MLPPRTYTVGQFLFEAYAAVLMGLVIFASLIPEVVSAREAARRACCVNNLRQHSGSHPDTVCLKRGRIVWVSSCWACGSLPDVQICFVEEKDGELLESKQALLEGLAVLSESLDRLRHHKVVRCKSIILETNPLRGYGPRDGSRSVPGSATSHLWLAWTVGRGTTPEE